MSDKVRKIRFSGYKEGKIGTPLNIHDKYGNELFVGDKISLENDVGRILYNPSSKTYCLVLNRSMWYGNNEYDVDSYGKSVDIKLDDGMRMSIVKLIGE